MNYLLLLCRSRNEEQAGQSLEMEIDGYKKGIAREQEQNEKLMLIAQKWDQEIALTRKQLAQTEAKHTAAKEEYSTYSRTLHETEQALQKSQADRDVRLKDVKGLRMQIEREHAEKVRLEDEIMAQIRSRLTLNKAAQYTDKIQNKTRSRTKELVCFLCLEILNYYSY